ncbi:MAG TPA: PVC-type heme-binding CxxCH protein [Caulifigura sp.]|nr:PVC-type heme-binding CxxCH protein [Caulifigura sp.]
MSSSQTKLGLRLALTLVTALSLCASAHAADNPIYNSETDLSVKPLTPAEAAKAFQVPEGFKVQVYAAEPDVQNPIAMAWDGRGRLWIAENYTYGGTSAVHFDLGLRDRILIFEDANGDGVHDKRTVFTEDVQRLSGIEIGSDGVWVIAPPRLMFIPDKNHDDIPDGPAVTVLDGFNLPEVNYHNMANGIKFGPDGWLYGRCGASCPGEVGKPGTPAEERIPLRGGVWRYHPQREVFEPLCHGTTNPWGHDWTAEGELFFINTVGGHLWHMIPGAHYLRSHTIDPNPRAYGQLDMHADHWHWDNTKNWTDSRGAKGKHDDLGGGHAHIGCTIYLGDNWPEQYRGRLLTLNQHGRRVNVDRIEREGCGFTARHEPDILKSADPWFRGLDLSYGPDGGVYILDWSDTGECHDHTGVHRTSGRIYKVTYGDVKPLKPFDFTKMSVQELVDAHSHANEWFVRQARRELVRRNELKQDLSSSIAALKRTLNGKADHQSQLKALWSLWSLGALNVPLDFANLQTSSNHESVRTWAIRLQVDDLLLDTVAGQRRVAAKEFDVMGPIQIAASDRSGLVRLAVASALQRIPVADRVQIAAMLSTDAKLADDHNMPLLIWYGVSTVAEMDPNRLADLTSCEVPLLRRFVARALAEQLEKTPTATNGVLSIATRRDAATQLDVLLGISDGLAGWQRAKRPAAWMAFYNAASKSADESVKLKLDELGALFGDGRALDEVRNLALDRKAEMSRRQSALKTLVQLKDPELRPVCEKLLDERFLNTHAARALAGFDDPAIGVALVKAYRKFHPSEQPAILDALVSRASFAPALLDQLEKGQIPKSDVTASQARQIVSLGNKDLTDRLSKVWGDMRESSAEAKADIARWKKDLTPPVLAKADMGHGRVLFNKACGNCHRLHGEGAPIGPDLTGAGRQNLDYLLGNIVAPAEVVNADYRLLIVALADGRVLNGIKTAETEKTLTLQQANAKTTIEKSEIDEIKPSNLSLMPDGLLKTLTDDDVKSLIAYLQHPTQVPLPAGEPAAKTEQPVGRD